MKLYFCLLETMSAVTGMEASKIRGNRGVKIGYVKFLTPCRPFSDFENAIDFLETSQCQKSLVINARSAAEMNAKITGSFQLDILKYFDM